jgi:hypothetical protein
MRRNNLLAAILAAATAGPVAAGQAILEWEPPTQNEDGSTLTDLAGYTVFWGCAGSRNYPNQVTILYPALRSFEVQGLPNTGTCYFAVQALNSGRGPRGTVPSRTSESSVYSDEASKAMNANLPTTPYTRAVEGTPVTTSTPGAPPPLEVLPAGRIRRAYVGDPVEFVVDSVSSPAPNRHELRARFIQSNETIVVPFTAARVQWTPPFAGLWYVSLRSCNTNGCGAWRSSVEDGEVWWFQLKAPTGGGIDP